jgi:hypothetical protein
MLVNCYVIRWLKILMQTKLVMTDANRYLSGLSVEIPCYCYLVMMRSVAFLVDLCSWTRNISLHKLNHKQYNCEIIK